MKNWMKEHPNAVRMLALAAVVIGVNITFSACGGESVTLDETAMAGDTMAPAEGETLPDRGGTEGYGSERTDANGDAVEQAASPVNSAGDLEGSKMDGSAGQANSAGSPGIAASRAAVGDAGMAAGIYVDVRGAVATPGVYEVPPGARVYEAVAAAGGLSDDAAAAYINEARLLEDGEQIYVPTLTEAQDMTPPLPAAGGISPAAADNTKEDGKVNINTADEAGLQKIPGVGKARAAAILTYRNEHGAFRNIEELMQVPGIKSALFNRMKESITVG